MHKLSRRRLVAGTLVATFACVSQAAAVSPRQLLEVIDIGRPVMSPDGLPGSHWGRAGVDRTQHLGPGGAAVVLAR